MSKIDTLKYIIKNNRYRDILHEKYLAGLSHFYTKKFITII